MCPNRIDRHLTKKPLTKQRNKKTFAKLHRAEWVLTAGIFILFSILSFCDFFKLYELKTYDFLLHLKRKPPTVDKITHIDIDDKSLSIVGKWPWSREKHARLIRTLNRVGARIICFDVLFIEKGIQFPKREDYKTRLDELVQKLGESYAPPEKTPSGTDFRKIEEIRTFVQEEIVDEDKEFARAIRQSRAEVFLPFYIPTGDLRDRMFYTELEQKRSSPTLEAFQKGVSIQTHLRGKMKIPDATNAIFPIEELLPSVAGSGFVNSEPDLDGTMRRTPLLWRVREQYYPQMFLMVALRYLGIRNPSLEISHNEIRIRGEGTSELRIPVTPSVNMLINWAGRWKTDFLHVPYSTVLAQDLLNEQIDGLLSLLDQRYGQGEIERLRQQILIRRAEGKELEAVPLEEALLSKKKDLLNFLQRNLERGRLKFQKGEAPPDFAAFESDVQMLQELIEREAQLTQELKARFEDKICLVGLTATGTHDIKPTPLQSAYPMVGMNSNLINTILTGKFIRRLPQTINLLLILVSALVTCSLTLYQANWKGALLTLLYIAGYLVLAFQSLDKFGLWIDSVGSVGCSALTFATLVTVRYTQQEIEKRWIKNAFQSYLSESVVNEIIANPEKLKLGGEMRNMTFLFADIRGFTTISEQFDAEGLTQFINRFLTPMSDLILKRRGTIDKYMGDCIMAFWNAPLDDPDHSRNACQAALDMQSHLTQWNEELQREAESTRKPFFPIRLGIGINTGNCCVGNMGSARRFNYSVLGDEVNLASRLEGQSKIYGVEIVIGQNTWERIKDYATLELDLVQVKGKTKPVQIYALLGDTTLKNDLTFRTLAERHQEMLSSYRAQDWDRASSLLEGCRKAFPVANHLATLYDLYAERIAFYKANPPGADWDGITIALSK